MDHLKVLQEIQARAPKHLLKIVYKEIDALPTTNFLVDKVLADKDVPNEYKEKLQQLKDKGFFNKKEIQVNEKVHKMLENYYAREIKKAIKQGRLPKHIDIKDLLNANTKTTNN